MGFPLKVKQEVLVKCNRICVLCGQLCTTNIEVHHIIQEADGGSNDIDNAIPLCSNCHAIVGSYNPHHPRGTKFTPYELKTRRNLIYQRVEQARQIPIINSSPNFQLEHDMHTFKKLMMLMPKNGSIAEIGDIDWRNNRFPSSAINDIINTWHYTCDDRSFFFLNQETNSFLDVFRHSLKQIYYVFDNSLMLDSHTYYELLHNKTINPQLLFQNTRSLIESYQQICNLCEHNLNIPHNVFWEFR